MEADPILSTPPMPDRPQQHHPEAVSIEPRSTVQPGGGSALPGGMDVGPISPYMPHQGGGLYGQGMNGPVGGMEVCLLVCPDCTDLPVGLPWAWSVSRNPLEPLDMASSQLEPASSNVIFATAASVSLAAAACRGWHCCVAHPLAV